MSETGNDPALRGTVESQQKEINRLNLVIAECNKVEKDLRNDLETYKSMHKRVSDENEKKDEKLRSLKTIVNLL